MDSWKMTFLLDGLVSGAMLVSGRVTCFQASLNVMRRLFRRLGTMVPGGFSTMFLSLLSVNGVFLEQSIRNIFRSTPSFQKYSYNIICTVRIIVIEYHGLTYIWTVPLIRRHWRWGARTWCSRCLSSSTGEDHPNLNSESIIPCIWVIQELGYVKYLLTTCVCHQNQSTLSFPTRKETWCRGL